MLSVKESLCFFFVVVTRSLSKESELVALDDETTHCLFLFFLCLCSTLCLCVPLCFLVEVEGFLRLAGGVLEAEEDRSLSLDEEEAFL